VPDLDLIKQAEQEGTEAFWKRPIPALSDGSMKVATNAGRLLQIRC
jgi:hypothetical protein